jgi:hypothetical protein
MKNKPNLWLVHCSAGCGTYMKRGSNSLMYPVCRRCRRRMGVRLCEYCNRPFRPSTPREGAIYCSIKCAAKNRWREYRMRLAGE